MDFLLIRINKLIELGDFDNAKSLIDLISEIDNEEILIKKTEINLSLNNFDLVCLDIEKNRTKYKKKFCFGEKSLVNAYLGDVDLPNKDKKSIDIFILLKYSKDMSFYNLEKKLEKDEYFKTTYSLFKGGPYVMYVFTLKPMFKNDFKKFLKGKYSKFSQPAKIQIMRDRNTHSPLPLILRKDGKYRQYWETKLDAILPIDSEVWPIVEYDKEIFDKSEFKELMSISDLPLSLQR